MRNLTRTTKGVVLALTASGGTLFAQDAPPCIVVHFQSASVIPGEAVIGGEQLVARIYHAIGVSIRWKNDERAIRASGQPGAVDVTVRTLSAPETAGFLAASGVSSDALGVAARYKPRAYLFGPRILEMSVATGQPLAVLFGRALAHEIGHLVLPGADHSETGIMRAGLSARGLGDPAFTTAQGISIRAWLASGRMLNGAADELRFTALDQN